ARKSELPRRLPICSLTEFLLAGFAAVISVPLAIGLGMLSVHFRNRLPDKIINVISLAAISLPEFFVGYLLILFFAVKFG
ncbi:hypothetical protein ACC719_36490, partial [Rhizobium ruizarguesonis]